MLAYGHSHVDPAPAEPVKKSLTAETAETAEKKILRILGELCVLYGKTSHFFTRSAAVPSERASKTQRALKNEAPSPRVRRTSDPTT